MRVMFVYFNKDYRPRTMLSMSILTTIMQNEGHEVKIFDTSFYPNFQMKEWMENRSGFHKVAENLYIPMKSTDIYEDCRQLIIDFKPELIGFSYYSINEDMQEWLLSRVKSEFSSIKIIAGGPAVVVEPEKCIKQKYIDMICYGEGETLIKELCNNFYDDEYVNSIKGLWIKINGGVIKNGIAPLTNLDDLPMQRLNLYDPIHMYGLFDGRAYRMGHVEFTRGCPYNCTYCGTGSIKKAYDGVGNYVRHRDVERAVREYRYLKNRYNLEMFYFTTGTFTAMPLATLESLAKMYKNKVGLPFFALVRPETIKKRTAELLKEMGCIHVSIGVESGVESYRRKVLNRKMTNNQITNAVKFLKENNIKVSAYSMIGLPGMDRDHVFKTIELNKKIKPHQAIVSIFVPFPNNELTNHLIDSGMISKDSIVTVGEKPSIEIAEMSREEVVGLYNTFNLYIKFPKWTYAFIRLLEKNNIVTNFIRKVLYKVI